jgi:hypothetical protein
MPNRPSITLRILCAALALPIAASAQQLILTNPLPEDRTPEVIELPLAAVLDHTHLSAAQAQSIVATDVASGERIPTQIDTSDSEDKPSLLLLVHLAAHARQTIAFHIDTHAAPQEPQVFGREAQERKDDFAWENEQVAYRVYGPALQATGEIASGIDVWSKRVPNFVIDSFYKRDALGAQTHDPSLSYHKDNGQGLDSYYVGPTRGCGGTAVLVDGKLYTSKNYTNRKILADGPIRFRFEVSYAPWDANGISVTETKRITLDAATHLNRIESTYTFPGSSQLDLVAGLAVHEKATAAFPDPNVASVWDTPQDPTAGRIATGMIVPPAQHAKPLEAAGHALMVFPRHSGETFTYYAGSGWSKADMPTADAWNTYLRLQLSMIEHPIKIQWKTK